MLPPPRALSVLAFCCTVVLALCAVTVAAQPATYDLRTTNCAPPVLDQGICGGCYTFAAATVFSATACVSGITSSPLQMSPQFLLNVNSAYGQFGGSNACGGGDQFSVLQTLATYFNNNSGTYPLSCVSGTNGACDGGCMQYAEYDCSTGCSNQQSQVGACQSSWANAEDDGACCCGTFSQLSCEYGNSSSFASVSGITTFSPQWAAANANQNSPISGATVIQSVQQWISSVGPLAVAINACNDFQTYWQNLQAGQPTPFSGNCAGSADHAVSLIGWTNVGGQLCWIIQNSWGPTGDNGYGYVPVAAQNTGNAGDVGLVEPTGVQFSGASSSTTVRSSAPRTTTTLTLRGALESVALDDPGLLQAANFYASARGFASRAHRVTEAKRQVVNGFLYVFSVEVSDSTVHNVHVHAGHSRHSRGQVARRIMQSTVTPAPSSKTAMIAGSVVGGVVGFTLLVVVVLLSVRYFGRRRRQPPVVAVAVPAPEYRQL